MIDSLRPRECHERLVASHSDVVLLDVREPFERAVAKIEPSLFIPMNQIALRLREIPRDRTVVVYCHTGSRSALVAGYLAAQGFPRVANLTGGIDAWSVEVDPTIPRYD